MCDRVKTDMTMLEYGTEHPLPFLASMGVVYLRFSAIFLLIRFLHDSTIFGFFVGFGVIGVLLAIGASAVRAYRGKEM